MMARRTYANEAAYDTIYGIGSAGTDGITDNMLAEATITVDELLIGAIYPVADIADDTNMPSQPREQRILTEAVCAQAHWMAAAGDTDGLGAIANVDSASIGSVSWSGGAGAVPGFAGATNSGRSVAAATVAVLRVAGMLPVNALVIG